MTFWLFKSEPSAFSIDDLAACPRKTTAWDGVRNYQARNLIRDEMQRGDEGFFYHSSCEVPAIVGIVIVTRAAYPEASQFDPASKYYDEQSRRESPRWYCVDVKMRRRLRHPISLERLRQEKGLADFQLLKRGNRLSVFPVAPPAWKLILAME